MIFAIISAAMVQVALCSGPLEEHVRDRIVQFSQDRLTQQTRGDVKVDKDSLYALSILQVLGQNDDSLLNLAKHYTSKVSAENCVQTVDCGSLLVDVGFSLMKRYSSLKFEQFNDVNFEKMSDYRW